MIRAVQQGDETVGAPTYNLDCSTVYMPTGSGHGRNWIPVFASSVHPDMIRTGCAQIESVDVDVVYPDCDYDVYIRMKILADVLTDDLKKYLRYEYALGLKYVPGCEYVIKYSARLGHCTRLVSITRL